MDIKTDIDIEGGFQNLGALFGSPYCKDHSMLGSVLGPPVYGKSHIFQQRHVPAPPNLPGTVVGWSLRGVVEGFVVAGRSWYT